MDIKEIGRKCKEYRLSIGLKQIDVARDLHYSIENIGSFEQGRNKNLYILLWYLSKGLPLQDII